ncbi:MAG: right-handed parallel beta-helix repeat-containing protein [Acidobacteriota bacterium]
MSRRYRSVHRLAALAAAVLLVATAAAATIDVPADYPTVQQALNVAMPGDTINVTGTYYEKIRFPRSGSAAGGYITLQAAPGATAVLAGTGVSGCDMVRITSQSYIRIIGFVIWDHTGVSDCSGVRMTGHGSHVEIRNNEIYKIRGTDAMGITIYGTDPQPISDLIIDGNFIHDCEPSPSEALTLNGNVTGFEVTNNFVRDVNNIGIDFIGGETSINPDPALVARNGLCRGNTVTRANSNYGGGFAGSIYVDGGKDIVIERNVVSLGDIGIEVGAENAGIVTSGVVVRDNFVFGSGKCGIAFGGYDATAGRADDNFFLGNTLYGNDTTGQGLGELFIQYGQNNTVRGNVFYSNAQNVLLYSELGNVNNALDWNGWYCPGGASAATFTWRSTPYTGFAAYQAGSGQDGSSLFADPALVAPAAGNLHLQAASPCLDRGDPAFVPGSGETDVDGQPRVANGRVDLGADEVLPGGQSPEDILTGQGPAPPNPNEVKVFAAAGQVVDFFAYAAGGFGTNVAAGNVDVDATSEIVARARPRAGVRPASERGSIATGRPSARSASTPMAR